MNRDEMIERLADPGVVWDVLIIGGDTGYAGERPPRFAERLANMQAVGRPAVRGAFLTPAHAP